MRAREGVRVCVLSREGESLCADKLPMEYSESTVAPEASHGPRGRDRGRERGSSVIEGRGGCIGCLNSSKSRGSAVCVWCHALRGGTVGGGRRAEGS